MIRQALRTVATLVITCTAAAHAAVAQPGPPGSVAVPPVPANLEPPAGHVAYFKGYAAGTQNFICLQTASGVAWRFVGPQATLFHTFRGEPYQQITTHFLGANPAEGGLPRPTWQHSFDTSAVWARVMASSTDPAFVEPGAIPWLLLEAAGAAAGPSGGDFLSHTTFIHRLNTAGGTAPAAGCSQPADAGAVALVPYSADYVFYRDRRPGR